MIKILNIFYTIICELTQTLQINSSLLGSRTSLIFGSKYFGRRELGIGRKVVNQVEL